MDDTPASTGWHAPDYAAASRAALVEALTAAGPGRPTLCDGWNTEHLAAHVHLRETTPSAAGLVLPGLGRRIERRTQELGDAHATDRSFAELVALVARGPLQEPDTVSRLGGRLRGLAARARRTRAGRSVADRVQLLEFYVHTEDVRRAQGSWAPRILADGYADTLFTQLKARAGLLYRGEGTGVELVRQARPTSRTDNAPFTARAAGPGEPTVRVAGPVGELVLHAFGRRRASLVLEDRTGA